MQAKDSVERLDWANGTNITDDVEMQQSPKHQQNGGIPSYHMASLHCLFGLPEEQLRNWPGAIAYCRYLEGCFQPLLTQEYAVVWTTIGKHRPKMVAECWPWFNAVSFAVRKLKDENSSIEDVWDCLGPPPSGTNITMPDTPEETAGLIAVFSVLCWGTMTLQPRLSWTDFKGSPSLMLHQQQLDQPGLKMDFVRRPIPAIFRQFQRTMPRTRWRHPISESKDDGSTVLHVNSLNYKSLRVIGKIHLVWVNNLTSHLDFDATNRRLSIFKFPSFCALRTLADGQAPPVFEGLLRALYGADADAVRDYENNAQSHQEVLMSYRLLFGQTRGAQRLARAALKELREQEGEYDSLLDLLCTRPCDKTVLNLPLSLWPVTCRSHEGSLQEESTYSSQDDFPLFGQRLTKLQEFSLRQQPSRLRDLWRDRRNPLQWYTFWAVLVIGGFSSLVTFLQLLVSTAQLAATYTVAQPCSC